MSDLEEGEIENSEPETDTAVTGDFNDERLIDQLVENGNETARRSSSPNICVTTSNRRIQPAEPVRNSAHQSNKTNKKHRRSDPKRYSRNSSPPRRSGPSTSSTWHTSGGRQQPRAPPPESVIFPQSQSYDMSRTVDPSICRLQSLMTHTRPGMFYPMGDVPPPIFFPSPPVLLQNLSMQPPPPPLIPQVDNANQPSPGYFRGGNYDEVAMDESYDTDYRASVPVPAQSSSSIQLIQSVPPPTDLPAPQPELQAASSIPRVSKASTSSATSEEIVDTAEFRKKLIMDMMENKKRKPTPDLSSPKKNLTKKARRTSSSSAAKTVTVDKPSIVTAEPVVERMMPEPAVVTTALPAPVPPIQATPEPQPSPVPVANPVPPVIRSLSAESSEEQLKTRLDEVEGIREDNRKKIAALNEEYRQTMKRMEELKTEMHDAREVLKSAVAEKRQIQEWLDDKELHELDILFSDSQFVGFRTPVIKVEKTAESEPVNVQIGHLQQSPANKTAEQDIQPLSEKFASEKTNASSSSTQHSFQEPIDDEERMSRTSSSRESDSNAVMTDGNVSDDEREGDVDTEDLNLESITSDESVDMNHYEQEQEEEETETVVTGLSAEMSLREKLLAKCNMSTRQSPDTAAQVSSSSERAETCRNLLLSTCKFGYNGTCAKGRECTFLHLHQINDTTKQTQLLESIFRDVLGYNDGDIEMAIKEVMYYLPHFRDFEKLVQYFLNIVMKQTPMYRDKLFEFFTSGR